MKLSALQLARLCLIVVTMQFCPVAQADIAALDSSRFVWLGWREGDKVYRGFCDPQSTLRDRARCNQDMRIRDAKKLYEAVMENYREPVEAAERLVSESYVNIQLVDQHINRMIKQEVDASGTQAQGQALLDAVIDMRIDLAREELTRVELQEQVARVELALTEGPTEDLTNQLYILRKQLRTVDTRANGLRDQISSQYRQYSELNSQLLDETVYQGLQLQRENSVMWLAQGIRASKEAVDNATNAALCLKMFEDHTFVYNHERSAFLQTAPIAYFIYNYFQSIH